MIELMQYKFLLSIKIHCHFYVYNRERQMVQVWQPYASFLHSILYLGVMEISCAEQYKNDFPYKRNSINTMIIETHYACFICRHNIINCRIVCFSIERFSWYGYQGRETVLFCVHFPGLTSLVVDTSFICWCYSSPMYLDSLKAFFLA